MEIRIIYSKDNAKHKETASYVRKAVKNLGIIARINEFEGKLSIPHVLVNGFDLFNNVGDGSKRESTELSYEIIEKALERSAWTGI